ncbi:LexA regulated protein [Marinomonas epiphytica]
MAKASSDRNTIDLFNRPVGRPRSQSLPRKDQLKRNKRLQREKEKALGLRRLELLVDQETLDKLDMLCEQQDIKRAQWVTMQVALAFSKQRLKKDRKNTKTAPQKNATLL